MSTSNSPTSRRESIIDEIQVGSRTQSYQSIKSLDSVGSHNEQYREDSNWINRLMTNVLLTSKNSDSEEDDAYCMDRVKQAAREAKAQIWTRKRSGSVSALSELDDIDNNFETALSTAATPTGVESHVSPTSKREQMRRVLVTTEQEKAVAVQTLKRERDKRKKLQKQCVAQKTEIDQLKAELSKWQNLFLKSTVNKTSNESTNDLRLGDLEAEMLDARTKWTRDQDSTGQIDIVGRELAEILDLHRTEMTSLLTVTDWN
eukprot:m.268353 g.268353  ORF g.268353 m.268353 type:complete len:260 (+) comp78105_c0_seq1:303-1082(+)